MTRSPAGRPPEQRFPGGAGPGDRSSRHQLPQHSSGAGRPPGYGVRGHPVQGYPSGRGQGSAGSEPVIQHRAGPGINEPVGAREVGAAEPVAAQLPADRRPDPHRLSGSYGVAARGRGKPYRPEADHRPSRLARFVETYGWRAYAIPILAVATFMCGVDLIYPAPRSTSGTAPTVAESRNTQIYVELPEDEPAGGARGAANPDSLPPGTAAYVTTGKGTFRVVPGSSPVSGRGPLQRYTVEVENGITLNERAFATEVEKILGDRRGWGAGGRMSFRRVDDPAQAAFRVTLTSTMTVRQFCGYTVRSETSCFNSPTRRAVINNARWARGAMSFAGDLELYRQYVITHEVGHAFEHKHEMCTSPGAPAPVMMQQTLTTSQCRPNPWPFPDGVHEVRGPPAPDNLPVGN